jgi:hypothetical protein
VIKENHSGEKVLILIAKTAEASTCKILKNNGEEAVVEQMLITSGINVQLEQAINALKPFEIPMKNPESPPELECLGFRLSDFSIDFKKGYLEIGQNFRKVDKPSDPEICKVFIEAMRKGPETMLDVADKVMKNPNQYMEDFKKGVRDSQVNAGQ